MRKRGRQEKTKKKRMQRGTLTCCSTMDWDMRQSRGANNKGDVQGMEATGGGRRENDSREHKRKEEEHGAEGKARQKYDGLRSGALNLLHRL